MLLANWIRHCQVNREDLKIFYRFIGGSDGSTTVDGLLRSLLTEMKANGIYNAEIPDDPDILNQKFSKLLEEVKRDAQILIVIESLNQLVFARYQLLSCAKKKSSPQIRQSS